MNSKILKRSELKSVLDDLRRNGSRIVLTNGCFDLIHAGHVRYLEEARSLGDCLVVAVNSDDSVRALKGAGRPYISDLERAEMLAGLGCVDYVTVFEETTASAVIRELKPHIYAKGGDIVADQVPESDALAEVGAEIAVLSKVEGRSTSELVKKIRSVSPASDETDKPVRVVGMIPARLAATRLPNKPLIDIAGKPMIQWVYERAKGASLLSEVIVATPDEEIRECVESFGGTAVMTSHTHRSGTDRLCEAARKYGGDLIVNIQGDEPLLDSDAINLLADMMLKSPDLPMGSLMCRISSEDEFDDPAVVKVVTDRFGNALYFSRARIPYPRNPDESKVFKHIGIYAYRKHFLLALAALDQTPLEKSESLEQLRALENGYRIRMAETTFSPTSVDTPEDLDSVRRILKESRG
ncbi:MAG TPA: 3-deoxy-manno-octulosonate cytidylyltransferase [Armatimonadota bacterium]